MGTAGGSLNSAPPSPLRRFSGRSPVQVNWSAPLLSIRAAWAMTAIRTKYLKSDGTFLFNKKVVVGHKQAWR